MRCLNCRTGLMATDTRCPVCGMATQFGQAAATSLWARAAVDPAARRSFFVKKWAFGLFALVAGGLVTIVGAGMFLDARENPPRAREVTATELLQIDNPEALPDWISYTPDKVLNTRVEYVKLRSRQATSKFLLLQVKDRWLLTKVAAHFDGVRVEGKLEGLDTVALPKVQSAFPTQAKRLLPYQLDGEYNTADTQRQSSILGGFVAVFGVLLFFSGVGSLVVKPPPFVGTATEGPVGHASIQPAFQPEHPPQPRRWVVRAFFGVVWAVLFFVVAALIASALATQGAGDDPEVRKQLTEESAKKLGPWFFFGSIFLATVLGYLGRLPGTRR